MAAAGRSSKAVALVTGANKGIGLAIARQLAHTRPNDLHVLVGSRDVKLGEDAVAQLRADGLQNVSLLRVDLLDEDVIRAAAQTVQDTYGGLDVLVNNAGMAFKGDAFDANVARATIATNYYGTKAVCKHFLPLIKDYGRVVNVTSRAGLLSKLSPNLQQAFSKEDLTLSELDSLMEKFSSDIASWSPCPKTTTIRPSNPPPRGIWSCASGRGGTWTWR